MAYSGYDYTDFFGTAEGKSYYEKYLKDMNGIDEDWLTTSTSQKLKNNFYDYVNKTYEIQDKIIESAFSGFDKIKIIAIIALCIYIYFKFFKGVKIAKSSL